MEALLRYALYHFTRFILTAEIAIMLAACISIACIKAYTNWKADCSQRLQARLSSDIESVFFHRTSITTLQWPFVRHQYRDIIEVLEKFDQRISDPLWLQIKQMILEVYLLPYASMLAASLSWVKRQLAARCYLLWPEKAPKDELDKLLHDKKYLVRVVAAVCIAQSNHRDLFQKMIWQMSKEYELSRFSYRDALIQASPEKFLWLEEILKGNPPSDIAAICLDVLATRLSHSLLPIIKSYVSKEDPQCRLLAIKALGNLPSKEACAILQQHLVDSSWEIRAESIKGIVKLYATETIPQLTFLLNDPMWWVRLQAALALKEFGPRGQEILLAQTQENSKESYEIAQYVLSFADANALPSTFG